MNNVAPNANGVGHVVVQDRRTGAITDPEALGGSNSAPSLGSYLVGANHDGAQLSVVASASATAVHAVLAASDTKRAAVIDKDAPALEPIEDHEFADGGNTGGGPSFGGNPANLTVSGTGEDDTALTLSVSDALWSGGQSSQSTGVSGVSAPTLQALGATPQVASRQLNQDAAAAEQLSSGSSVQSLLAAGTTTDTINGAYELLGISNRQITQYAQAAAEGGYGSNPPTFGSQSFTPTGTAAFSALKTAMQMRAALSGTGQHDIQSLGSGIAIIGSGPGGVVAGATALIDPVAGGLGVDGAYDGALSGVQQSNKFWLPSSALDSMLYGDTGPIKAITPSQSAFGGHGVSAAQNAVGKGNTALQTTQMAVGSPSSTVGVDPLAVQSLWSLSTKTPGDWTADEVETAFNAANALVLTALSNLNGALTKGQNQLGTAGGTEITSGTGVLQPGQLDQALKQAGVSGLSAQDIGDILTSAAASPAFAEATGGNQQVANSAYALMAVTDPQSLQHLELVQNYGMAGTSQTQTQTQNRKPLTHILEAMAETPFSQPAVVTPQQQAAAGSTIAAWSIGSARWLLDAAQKTSVAAYNGYISKLPQFSQVVQAAAAAPLPVIGMPTCGSSSVPQVLFPLPNGQTATLSGLMDYAAKQAGFPSNVAMELQSSANTFAKGANLFAGIGALGQVVDRAFQLADATSASDKALIAARFIPDVASIASWAAKPGGRIGSALVNGVAALGNGANNLASYAGLAAAAPPISVDPGSSLGAFFNGVFNYGGTGALFGYGGLNTGQGLYNALTGKPIAGSLRP